MPILPKSKPKFIQQHHHLPTLSKFHKPPTLSKLHHEKKKTTTTLQECSKANIFKHDQSHNALKFQNNQMTISHHETFNKTYNNIFPSKETKEKLTLVSTWQYGAWVLGSWRSPSSSCHSNVGSYFLPWKARKEDPMEKEAILMKRKWVSQKMGMWWKYSKHKDLKKYW